MLNPRHFRQEVVRPTLQEMQMWSPAAEALLMGTAMQESRLEHLVQLDGGPARSFYQIEPPTAADIVYRYLERRPDAEEKFERAFRLVDSHDIDWSEVQLERIALALISDLRFATALARLRYRMVPAPLPEEDDVAGLARYWKQHYNTARGAGTEAEFISHYEELRAAERRAPR